VKYRWIQATAVVLLGAAIAGCASAAKPSAFGADPPSVSFPAASVSVAPVIRPDAASRLNANGVTFPVDLNEYSDELAGLVRKSLEQAGVHSGPQVIRIQVDYIDFMYQGPCILDYRVQLGDLSAFGLQSKGDSALFNVACAEALESAVVAILSDGRTRSFMVGK
jgi:hypothetical protein